MVETYERDFLLERVEQALNHRVRTGCYRYLR